MPKHFDTKEKEYIHQRLLEEGRKSWERYGIKRTNIEDVCRAAGISKGSFYSFFDSKELLFLEILEQSEETIKARLMEVTMSQGGSGKERFVNALGEVFKETRKHPWLLSLMKNREEYEQLVRKLPGDRLKAHMEMDEGDTEQFLKLLGAEATGEEIRTISAALRGLFLLLLHEEEIGEEQMEPVIRLLLGGLAEGIFGRGSYD